MPSYDLRALMTFLIFLIVVLVAFAAGFATHKAFSINYRKRWLTSNELVKTLTEDGIDEAKAKAAVLKPGLPPPPKKSYEKKVNGWTIERYTTIDGYGQRLVALRLRQGEETIKVDPPSGWSSSGSGLQPSHEYFPVEMQEYWDKAEDVADAL